MTPTRCKIEIVAPTSWDPPTAWPIAAVEAAMADSDMYEYTSGANTICMITGDTRRGLSVLVDELTTLHDLAISFIALAEPDQFAPGELRWSSAGLPVQYRRFDGDRVVIDADTVATLGSYDAVLAHLAQPMIDEMPTDHLPATCPPKP